MGSQGLGGILPVNGFRPFCGEEAESLCQFGARDHGSDAARFAIVFIERGAHQRILPGAIDAAFQRLVQARVHHEALRQRDGGFEQLRPVQLAVLRMGARRESDIARNAHAEAGQDHVAIALRFAIGRRGTIPGRPRLARFRVRRKWLPCRPASRAP